MVETTEKIDKLRYKKNSRLESHMSEIINFPIERTKKNRESVSYIEPINGNMEDNPVYQTILDLLDEASDSGSENGKPNSEIAKDIFRRFELARKTREWM